MSRANYAQTVQLTRTFLDTQQDRFFPYIKTALRRLVSTHDLYFVTAEPQFVTEALGVLYPVCGSVSSRFEVVQSKFNGRVEHSLASSIAKQAAIDHLIRRYPYGGSVVYGDSEGDIGMLGSVEQAFCVRPTAFLRAHARSCNWNILEHDQLVTAR